MNLKHTVSSVVLVAALAGVTGCGSQTEPSGYGAETSSSGAASTSQPPSATGTETTADTAPTGDPAANEKVVVTISNFEYELPDSIAPGATVTVTNEDSAPHTVTATDEGNFDVKAPAGETVTFTAPQEPGEYEVICIYHPQMSGTLVVQ